MAHIEIDLSKMAVRNAHDLLSSAIIPRPIAWVSSISSEGKINLAPFSFFSGVTWSPPILSISIVKRRDGTLKDTIRNIDETGHFVVNMVSESMGPLMVETAVAVNSDVDEAEAAGITLIPSTVVKAPRIRDAGISFECVLDRIVEVGTGVAGANLVLGRIQVMHVDEEILESGTGIDVTRARILGRLSGTRYCSLQNIIEINPRKS